MVKHFNSLYCPFKRNHGGQKNKKLVYMRDGYTLPAMNLCHTSHIRSHAEAGEGRGRMQGIFRRNMAAEGESRQRKKETDGKKAGKERRTVKRQGKRDAR